MFYDQQMAIDVSGVKMYLYVATHRNVIINHITDKERW